MQLGGAYSMLHYICYIFAMSSDIYQRAEYTIACFFHRFSSSLIIANLMYIHTCLSPTVIYAIKKCKCHSVDRNIVVF